jgi:hypothetical protein
LRPFGMKCMNTVSPVPLRFMLVSSCILVLIMVKK